MTQENNTQLHPDLLAFAINATGGLKQWKDTKEILITGIFSGLLLAIKSDVKSDIQRTLRIKVDEMYVEVSKYPVEGYKGIWLNDRVQIIEEATGKEISGRLNPRKYFTTLGGGAVRRLFCWDHLDVLYFVSYAVWNYFLTPYMLTFNGVETKEVPPDHVKKWLRSDIHTAARRWLKKNNAGCGGKPHKPPSSFRVLKATFPKGFPTHSSTQHFFFDSKTGLLRKVHYKLDISWIPSLEAINFACGFKWTEEETRLKIFHKRDIYVYRIPLFDRFFPAHNRYLRNIRAVFGRMKSVETIKRKISPPSSVDSSLNTVTP